MAGNSYFTGAPGLTEMSRSTRWGDTAGGGMVYNMSQNGQKRYFVPETFGAGNNWSSASIDPSKAAAAGWKPYTTESYTTRNSGNPFSNISPYNQDINNAGTRGYIFDTMPENIEDFASFTPGRGDTNAFQNRGLLALAAAVGGGAMLGGMGGGATTPIAGGGTLSTTAAAPGGALTTGAGASGVGTTGMGMGGVAAPTVGGATGGAGTMVGSAGSAPAFGGMAGSTAKSMYSSTPAGGGIFDSILGEAKDLWGGLSNNQKLGGALGLADLGLRYKQGQDLKNIAGQAADRGDALKQPERLPYQALLSDYMLEGKPLTDQPMIKAQQDLADRQIQAYMAKMGQTGAGDAPLQYAKGMNEALNASAMPYLQQLSGNAGFGFGPGYSGNIYGQYASQATGALPMGLEALARGLSYNPIQSRPYQQMIYNNQQQMQGMGPGSNYEYTY